MARQYRVLKRTINNEVTYKAQIKGWFFWKSFWTGKYVHTLEEKFEHHTDWEDDKETCTQQILDHKARTDAEKITVVQYWGERE